MSCRVRRRKPLRNTSEHTNNKIFSFNINLLVFVFVFLPSSDEKLHKLSSTSSGLSSDLQLSIQAPNSLHPPPSSHSSFALTPFFLYLCNVRSDRRGSTLKQTHDDVFKSLPLSREQLVVAPVSLFRLRNQAFSSSLHLNTPPSALIASIFTGFASPC
eukprot:764749-Hanusia_phi.AAC.1